MPARTGQNMQKGHPLVRAGLRTCLQPKRHTAAIWAHSPALSFLSSLTPTFLWLYWSVLTKYVWLNGCSINPSSWRVQVLAQQSPQKQALEQQQHLGCCGHVAGASLCSEGIVALQALIIAFTHSQPSNADVARDTGESEWCNATTIQCV